MSAAVVSLCHFQKKQKPPFLINLFASAQQQCSSSADGQSPQVHRKRITFRFVLSSLSPIKMSSKQISSHLSPSWSTQPVIFSLVLFDMSYLKVISSLNAHSEFKNNFSFGCKSIVCDLHISLCVCLQLFIYKFIFVKYFVRSFSLTTHQ